MRLCQICGMELPIGSSASRKYCQPCSKQHNIELTKLRQQRFSQKRSDERAKQAEIKQPIRDLREEDKAYCAKCVYTGRFSEDYLCNYLAMEGHRRGCRAGKGCTKRKLIPAENSSFGERVCEKCGAAYTGGKKSHYCPDCRKIIMRQNAIHAVELRRTHNGG